MTKEAKLVIPSNFLLQLREIDGQSDSNNDDDVDVTISTALHSWVVISCQDASSCPCGHYHDDYKGDDDDNQYDNGDDDDDEDDGDHCNGDEDDVYLIFTRRYTMRDKP